MSIAIGKLVVTGLAGLLLSLQVVASELAPVVPARPIPATVLPGIDGKLHNLAQHRGKVILVNFWASWCPPCRAEMPSIWRLKQKLGSSRFEVIAINIGEDADTIKAFMPNKLLRDFVVLLDRQGQVSRTWDVEFLPATFVVDSEGRIQYVLHGAAKWDRKEIVQRINQLAN